MNVKYPAATKLRMGWLQVRKQWVVDALEAHDQIEIVTDPSGGRTTFATKAAPLSNNYWGILVIAREKDARLLIEDVLKVPPGIVTNPEAIPTPTETLSAIAERYGVPLQIGNMSRKFIISTKMKLTERPGISLPRNFQGLASVSIAHYESYGEKYFDFVFGYAIEMRSYLPAVGLKWFSPI